VGGYWPLVLSYTRTMERTAGRLKPLNKPNLLGRLVRRFAPLIYNGWERRKLRDDFEDQMRASPGDEAEAAVYTQILQGLSEYEDYVRTSRLLRSAKDCGAKTYDVTEKDQNFRKTSYGKVLVWSAFEELTDRRNLARRQTWLFRFQVVSVFTGLVGAVIGLLAFLVPKEAPGLESYLAYLLSELNRQVQHLLHNPMELF